MADLTPDLHIFLSWRLIAKSFHSLQSLSVSCFHVILGLPGQHFPSTCISKAGSSWASQANTFHQPVYQRLSWLHHWSIPHVHTSGAFSPSEWGPDPQCQAPEVAHWTWLWEGLAAWHCRSVWSLPCLPLQTLEVWFCQWPSLTGMEHCTPHTRAVHLATCLEREVVWRENWELVAAPWTSSRRFHMCCGWKFTATCYLACLLGSKRKLPPPACQVQQTSLCGLPSKGRAVPWHLVHL